MNFRRTLIRATELQARWLRWRTVKKENIVIAFFKGILATAGQL
jgi:hypothetical protein